MLMVLQTLLMETIKELVTKMVEIFFVLDSIEPFHIKIQSRLRINEHINANRFYVR